jgi:hypothetical protein
VKGLEKMKEGLEKAVGNKTKWPAHVDNTS